METALDVIGTGVALGLFYLVMLLPFAYCWAVYKLCMFVIKVYPYLGRGAIDDILRR